MSAEKHESIKVQPWSGKLEDRLVVSLIIAILLVATILLNALHPSQEDDYLITPKPIRQVLTELSVTAEELALMLDFGESVDLTTLVKAGISPFADKLSGTGQFVWQQNGACYIGELVLTDTSYQTRLILTSKTMASTDSGSKVSEYVLQWREFEGLDAVEGCYFNDSSWNGISRPKNHIHSSSDSH